MRDRIDRRWRRVFLFLAGAQLAPAMTAPGAQQVTYTGSLHGASGDYIFTERTSSVALVSGLALELGRLHLSATVPLLLQSAPWVTTGGAGPVPTGGPRYESVAEWSGRGGRQHGRITLPASAEPSEVGIGDPMLFAGVSLVEGGAGPGVSLEGAVKAPVADVARGLGTGEWDYGAGLGASLPFGRTALYLDGMYWVLGDMPGLPLRDVLSWSGAIGRIFRDGEWSALASVSGSGATIEGSDAPVQAGVMLGRRWASGRTISASLSVGLTESASDVAGSVGWRVPLSRAP
ncbi:MAG TPA: hypothetical protein VFZ11_12610 [Gemmatimonadaceae bacterium]